MANTKKVTKGDMTNVKMSLADNTALAVLLQGKAQEAAKAAPKAKPEAVDKGLHGLAVKMVQAEGKFDTAQNAVYAAFKGYVVAALPIIARLPAHIAACADIRVTFGEARAPAAIQRITMLNNIRTIAHGKPATRTTAAQPAQGIDVVLEALNTCESLPALKKALTLLKSETHGATGVTKHSTKAKPAPAKASAPVKADDVQIPGTRAEAIKAACRILEMVSTNFLTISKDKATIDAVATVVKMLRAA